MTDVLLCRVLRLPYTPNPSAEAIDKYHDMYIASLRELYDAHKCDYGYDNSELEIW
jgi:hypothetical protein